MDCSVIQPDLFAYHFATLDEEARARVDEHLLGCQKCLRAYLGIKRHMELGVGLPGRPSEAARLRLREAVADAFRPSLGARLGRWLRRPIPLYQGLATAAVVLLLASITPLLLRRPSPSALPGGERVDTSRSHPASLAIY